MKTRVKKIMAYVLSLAMIASLALDMSTADVQAAKKYVKSLKVAKSVSVSVGKSKTVKVKVKAVKKASTKIKATSNKKSVATVKVKGKKITITGKKAGKAVVTVKTVAKGKKGKALSKKIKVTVSGATAPEETANVAPTVAPTLAPAVVPATQAPALPAQTVTLDKTNVTIAQTEGVKLVATIVPVAPATWSSSDASVATVDNTGYVKGVGVGTADITVTVGTASAVCKVTVAEKKYDVKNISAVNTDEGTITVTFTEEVSAAVLAGTELTLTKGNTTISATFKEVSEEGTSAVYEIPEDKLSLLQSGNYTIASDNMNIDEENATTSARVDVKGSSVKGLVYYKDFANQIYAIEDATITINGESVSTDEKGFYQKGLTGDRYTATVKANGFFDEKREEVIVSANKASAYNFNMEVYDEEKVYLYGTITDDTDSAAVISGAEVTLYEIDNGKETVKAVVTTDRNGKFVFANSDADYSKFDTNSAVEFERYEGMTKKCEYRVEVTKGLHAGNLFDVYEPYESADFDLGSARGVDVSAKLTKVKAISEMTMQLTWDGELVSQGDVEVTLLDTDGKTKLKKNVMTIDKTFFESETVLNKMKSGAYKMVSQKFFSDEENVKPTLPAGTYYLVIKTMDADGNYIDSTVVCPVTVTPGERADAEVGVVTAEATRDIKYTANFSDDFGAIARKNQGSLLNTMADNEGTLSGIPVYFDSYVYQVVDGVRVLINTTRDNVFEKNEDVFINTYKQTNLAKNATYYVETEKTHIVDGDKEFSTDTIESWNVEFTSAANVRNVKFPAIASFIDNQKSDNTAVAGEVIHVNAVTITVKPADTKKSTVTKTIEIDKDYTVSDLVNTGVVIDDIDAMGLPVGKYSVEFDFENFVLDSEYAEDMEETVIDLQDAQLVCEAKYEKVYPTTISGVIAYADTTKEMPVEGMAILYTSDLTKIVAAANFEKVDDQITYALVDGEDGTFQGGDYKLLIRGAGFDYTMKDVTVESNEVKKNVDFKDLEIGSTTSMKPQIKTNSGSGLNASATAIAYDKYYINPWDEAVDYYALWAMYSSGFAFDGSVELDRVDGSDISWIKENVSKGDYTLVVDSDVTDVATFDVALKSTYEDDLTVYFTVYDNLVRINLILSNKGEGGPAFEEGQLDYVTAISEDGTVSHDGCVLREQAEDDSVYFYVPKGKAYTITVYSDKNYVSASSQVAQYNEEENIYVTCQKIEQ